MAWDQPQWRLTSGLGWSSGTGAQVALEGGCGSREPSVITTVVLAEERTTETEMEGA